MDRRTLLKSLLGGGGVATLVVPRDAASRPATDYPTYANPLYAEGLRLHWSGWKASQEHRWLAGQWFAGPESGTYNPMYYYVNVPGMLGGRLYDPGNSVNLANPQDRYVYPETAAVEKDRLIWEGYQRLRDLLGMGAGLIRRFHVEHGGESHG